MTISQSAYRVYVIGILTVVKTVAIGLWLGYMIASPLLRRGTLIGFGVLVVGLILKHILTDISVNGLNLSHPISPGAVIVMTTAETVVWILWFLVARSLGGLVGVGIAAVYLAILLIPQHAIEDSLVRSESPFPDLIDRWMVLFSLLETMAATTLLVSVVNYTQIERMVGQLWPIGTALVKAGVALLAVLLFAEHYMNVKYYRRL